MSTPDLTLDGVTVRVGWRAIMRRIRWAAKRAGLKVPDSIDVRPVRGRMGGDPVTEAGSCVHARGRFRIRVCCAAPWLAGVEEVLVHEVAHAAVWGSEGPRPVHTPVWGAAYGAIYAGYFDLPKQGPPRPAFGVRRRK